MLGSWQRVNGRKKGWEPLS